ncbi:hypothetical protein RRG08_058339 [Elysia crispata]|uniref:Uncharacterized protein n=1 Tax=Elysia crispata TaxID=231223 RepID=A0AAE1B351_9GAST|nr:hypothetical protein RRG08_058339 [Elysia crispata]
MEIPQPRTILVDHWARDLHTGMADCYIPVEASGQTGDMARVVDSCLYYSGEVGTFTTDTNIKLFTGCSS